MVRLTLRTLLAYIDDTLDPATASELGKKVAASEEAQALIERIKSVTRRRRLTTPDATSGADETTDPNVVAAYLDNALASDAVKDVERTCLESDTSLAEVAACHQILTLILTEPVRVPPRAHQRMYGLVPAPAGDPSRQPNKALPVGGAAPPANTDAATEDTDAALLLGLKRYSASTPWAERVLLFGVAAVLALMLTAGVFVSLSREHVKPPSASAGDPVAALGPAIPSIPVPPPDPKPKDTDPPAPKAKDKDPDPVPATPMILPIPPDAPEPKQPVARDDVQPPKKDVPVPIRFDGAARGVVVAFDGDKWSRVGTRADDEDAKAGEPLMALPGYKATANVGPRTAQVEVHLWGNLPEQVPVRLFESRVTVHTPPAGFAADLTLHAGRVYLKARTGAPLKARVRAGDEVWDVTLPDAGTEVFVELISWFAPGTPFAATGGEKPRQSGRVAVVSGSARLVSPGRFVTYDAVPARAAITWETATNTVSPPRPVAADESLARAPAFDPTPRELVKALADLAAELTPKDGVASALGQRVDKRLIVKESAAARAAVFALAAIADGEQTGSRALSELTDLLATPEKHWTAEHAVVTALAGYVARDVRHTAALHDLLATKLKDRDDGPKRFVALLRGFVNPHDPDPARVEQLLSADKGAFLNDKEPAVQAAARWNLLALDQCAWVPRAVDPNRLSNATILKEWPARLSAPKK